MNHNLHSFEADNIVDALVQVRNSLGSDAIIVETRSVSPHPLLWMARKKVRVLAERQDNSAKRLDEMFSELRSLRGDLSLRAPAAPGKEPLQREAAPQRENPVVRQALAAGLSAAGAKRLETLLGNAAPGREALARLLLPEIKTLDILSDPGITILAGTTGVGKTTTLAKLAAGFSLSGEKSAVLISKDSFRIGAMDHLKTYADLLGIPFEAAFTPGDMTRAVNRHVDKYAVLIDTAGHSPLDRDRLKELQSLTASIPASRVLLTISLSQAPDCERIWKSFSALKPCGLVVTKLDETSLQWGLLDILRVTGLPLAFTTSGQNVPEDIAAADAPALAEMLAANLGEER
jgi:flagellar biosynthesis protein FlhF